MAVKKRGEFCWIKRLVQPVPVSQFSSNTAVLQVNSTQTVQCMDQIPLLKRDESVNEELLR